MSIKEKESKTFHEKLKNFFRLNKGGTGNFKGRVDLPLPQDIEKDLGPDVPLSHRGKAIKELSDAVLKNHLEDSAVEKLWSCLKDLLHQDVPREYRHLAFSFFRCLIQGQYDKLDIMRAHFFNVVRTHNVAEDVAHRFELLQSLTENGKDIHYFEEEMGPFMLEWMSAVMVAGRTQEFLSMLVNVIKFNAAYVDEEIVSGLVQNTCYLCRNSNSEPVVQACLQVMDTVLCYTNLPSDSLLTFVSALCRTVNEIYCQSSWKVMRNLLGTHLGHAALYTMCRLLQDQTMWGDEFLLRGAIFHITMGLWGTKKVTNLRCTPTSVLPSFLCVLECGHTLVMFEVTLSIQRLVNKYGLELQDPAWDLLLSVIEVIIKYLDKNPTAMVANHLHDTISTIEQLIELGQFNGSVRRVFELIERCSTVRPEASVLRLVSHLSGSIAPTCSLWLSRLNSLLDKYFKLESRTNIRVKVLDILSSVIHTNRAIYEDDLIERIVVPHLQHVDTDADLVVRNAAAQLLVDLCVECENKRCLELMDILEKLLNRPFEQFVADGGVVTNEMDVIDVKTVVMGLVKIFTVKLYQLPSSHATKAYKLLVNHLESHYSKPVVFENMSSIRYMIFDCLLQIRANSYYQVGYPESGSTVLRYSPYLAVDHKEGERVGGGSVSPPPMSPVPSSYPTCMVTHLSLTHALKAVITCLKQEKDWKVLQLILHELPHVMQNKALILSRHGNDIELLATALCSMVSDKSLGLPELLRNTPPKLTRSEFHGHVFPVLGALASYHTYLEPNLQQKIIKCLEFGLVSRCARQCVMALTTCTLEMSDAMYKLLPEVLLNLSKISATVHVAVPILEFLSTLTKLPKVFASFVGDQYMSVFAISLPYTNPFKYNHYTVSLAHHVIAMWFLKCRLSFRRDFVRFITCGLKANVLVPFEEGQVMKKELVNEDSSNRKRSSSLTEQGSRHNSTTSIRPIPRTGAMDLKPPIDEALMTFHVELTETCIDLMARYTFSSCSAFPKRFPTADFLLSGGQSMTWLLGNKLITVTTSGCSTKVLKNGLCDKCWLLCRADKEAMTPEGSADQDSFGTRRRHKSAVQRSVSTEVTPLAASMSKDDLNMPGPRLSRQISSEPVPLARTAVTTANSPVDDAVKRSFGIPETHEPEPHKLDQLLFGTKEPERHEKQLCACWCQGWAEIYVRRPTGDTSWVMRIQNQSSYQTSPSDFPLADITTLFMPSLTVKKEPEFGDYVSSQPRINTETLAESEYDAMLDHHFDTSTSSLPRTLGSGPTVPMLIPGSHIKNSPSRESVNTAPDDLDMLDVEEAGKSRNPVRRSNSSPEMSASWKNPFLNREKEKNKDERETGSGDGDDNKKTPKQKDPRVSCEAIPEEISGLGTTPPTGDEAGNSVNHPLLLSCHSYPGTATQSPPALAATARTVPPSPTSVISPSSTPIQSPTSAEKADIKSPIQKSPLGSDKSSKVISPRQAVVDEVHIAQKEDAVRPDPSALPPLHFKRDRGHTISVMSPVRKPPRMDWNSVRKDTSPRSKDPPRSGINPSFVFLQLYHTAHFGSTSEKPLLITQTPANQRAVKNLDRIQPYETHKVGVIYVGPGQASNEAEILRNEFGSLRYAEFLQRLGTLIRLKDADPQSIFLGGLDSNGNDGKFAYIWQDDVMQVTFHVATLMPTKETDPLCNGKKLHIGNDYVTIVYNESGQEYNIQTVKCQFNYACVIIQPLDHSTNQVVVKARDELAEHIGHSEPKIVSDQNLAVMARQLALHANLASMISRSLKAQGQDPYASNWLERLRQIKRLRAKVQQESAPASDSSSNDSELFTSPRSARHVHMDDFTEYT